KLSGFDWDYGGRVTDWRGGVLGKPQPGGCSLAVEFVHPEDATEENLTKVSGDREFLSDNADMRAVEPYVAVVILSYSKRRSPTLQFGGGAVLAAHDAAYRTRKRNGHRVGTGFSPR